MKTNEVSAEIAAWLATGIDLTQPIPLTSRKTVGCYYDGPAGTAWATRRGVSRTCAVPGCGKVISSGYHGCIVPGLHPIMVCGEHVVFCQRIDDVPPLAPTEGIVAHEPTGSRKGRRKIIVK